MYVSKSDLEDIKKAVAHISMYRKCVEKYITQWFNCNVTDVNDG